METEKVFKTKTGYCHVLEDKIVLTRNGVLGNVAKITMGNNIARPLIIYGILSALFILLAFKGFSEGEAPTAILFLILGLFLIIAVVRSRNNSAIPVIEKDKIREIEFKKAIPGATRAYFIVHFENANGQLKQRLILLPGSLTNGEKETEIALKIMIAEFGHIKNSS